jgi:hypothetical protein
VQAAEELGRRAGLAIAKQYYREQHVATLQRAFPFIPRDVIAIITVQFGVGNRQWRFEAGDSSVAYAIKREFISILSEFADAVSDQIEACELIFDELIGNAVRHAPGPLSISLSTAGNEVVLHIIDEGPGFEYCPSLPEDV